MVSAELIEGDSAKYVYTLPEPVRKVHCIELANCHIPYTFNNVIESNCRFKYTALFRSDLDLVLDDDGVLVVEQLVRGAKYTLKSLKSGLFELSDQTGSKVFECTFVDSLDVFELEILDVWSPTLTQSFDGAVGGETLKVVSYGNVLILPLGSYNPVQLGSKIYEVNSVRDTNLKVTYLAFSNRLQFTHTAPYFKIWIDDTTLKSIDLVQSNDQNEIETGYLLQTGPRYIRVGFENLNNSAAWVLIPLTTAERTTVHMQGQTSVKLKLDPPQDIYKLQMILTDSEGILIDTQGQKHSLFFNLFN